MLELLSPAGSPEAVIAAVQNGADAVYLGFGDYNARRGAKNFTQEEFEKAVRYCRVRSCKVYVTLNTLVNDREIEQAVRCARIAAKYGADELQVYEGMAKWSEIQYAYLINEPGTAKREEIITKHRNDEYGIGFLKYASRYGISSGTRLRGETPFENKKQPL